MTKKEIQDYKDKKNLKYGFNAYWNKGFGEAITLLNKQEKALNYTHSGELLCDCAMPDPIDPFAEVDKDTCRKCNNLIA